MTQETGKFKILINKMAAKSFSSKEKAVLLIAFIVLSASGLYYLKHWTAALKQEVKIIEPIVPKFNLKPSVKVSGQIEHKIKETASLFKKTAIRDPFLASKDSNILKTPTGKKKPMINLNLKGILWDKLVPSAIINSKVVKIGDLIFDKTVVDIEKDKVILMENGEIHILKLKRK